MSPRKQPPQIFYADRWQEITPWIIVRMARVGLTPKDYEILDLTRDYYNFATIGDLIADAHDRAGVRL